MKRLIPGVAVGLGCVSLVLLVTFFALSVSFAERHRPAHGIVAILNRSPGAMQDLELEMSTGMGNTIIQGPRHLPAGSGAARLMTSGEQYLVFVRYTLGEKRLKCVPGYSIVENAEVLLIVVCEDGSIGVGHPSYRKFREANPNLQEEAFIPTGAWEYSGEVRLIKQASPCREDSGIPGARTGDSSRENTAADEPTGGESR
ncbi:MAG: hypothetical protein ACYSU0_01330 [Planctomycetota bacterium]